MCICEQSVEEDAGKSYIKICFISLHSSPKIVSMIKSRRLMGKKSETCANILVMIPQDNRPLGKHKKILRITLK